MSSLEDEPEIVDDEGELELVDLADWDAARVLDGLVDENGRGLFLDGAA